MQNQPHPLNKLGFVPVNLPKDFPICTGGSITQVDRPIRQLHMHDCLEIGYCYDGSGVFIVENKVLPYSVGDVSFITRHEMHMARSVAGSVSPGAYIFFNPLDLLDPSVEEQKFYQTDHLQGDDFNNILSGKEHPQITQLIREIIDELLTPGTGSTVLIRGLISTFLVKLNRIYPDLHKQQTKKRGTLEQITPALELITHQFDHALSIPQLAETCSMSVTHFRRIFENSMGSSPQEYMIQFRIKLAGRLLRTTNRSILDIALSVGYNTLSSFNRHFKRVSGITPRELRNRP